MLTARQTRALLRNAAPRPLLALVRPLRDAWVERRYDGDAVQCPVCGRRFSDFAPFNSRPAARCPGCGALERHRLLWLYLDRCTDLFQRPQRVLHIAPEPFLRERLRSVHGRGYVHGDVSDREHRLDVTALQFEAASFDVVICSHVFEHVPDDLTAMRELRRVLAPGGWAILDAPVDEQREQTYEDPSVTSPIAREREFGQWDHVRIYGRDYTQRLESAGWQVSVDAWSPPAQDVTRYGLRLSGDHLYRGE